METTVNINIGKLKSDIKVLAEEQKFLRNQRKTVHIVGDRKIPASEATWKHSINRHKLRLMYAAHALMRGKTFSFVENKCSDDNHPLKKYEYDITMIINNYSNNE